MPSALPGVKIRTRLSLQCRLLYFLCVLLAVVVIDFLDVQSANEVLFLLSILFNRLQISNSLSVSMLN